MAGALAGVGVDAVDVARFRRVLDRRPRFAARCFTESERSDAGGSADVAQSLAARFAAKEAVMKALALRDRRLRAHRRGGVPDDRETVPRGTPPTSCSTAPPPSWRAQRGAGTFHLSLTHTDGVAIAFVVAEQAAQGPVRAVLTREEMRAADAAALETVSHETLVQRAGTATAHAALRLLGGAYGRRVVVVVGKGSNGADGRVAASFLARRGARVRVLEAAAAAGGVTLPPCDLVVDGAYGTGFRGSYDAPGAPAGARVLAIDIPSGVDADSGEAPGEAVQADRTVTFAALKPGLLQGRGAVCSGAVEVADIGIGFPTPRALLVEDADVARLPPRPRQVNKWTTAVGVAAGSAGMEGAAILCSRGAMAAGAGMLRLGSPGNPAAAWPTEAVRMRLPAAEWAGAFLEATAKCKAVVIGPGLGTDEATAAEIRAVVAAVPVPLVIDADALTALGGTDPARTLFDKRSAPTILTPTTASTRASAVPPRRRTGSLRRATWRAPPVPSSC